MGIDLFGHDYFGLALLLVEDRVVQRSALVENLDVILGILADSDLSMAQSIGGPGRLNLVDHLPVLQREVFGQSAGLLERKDDIEFFF